MQELTAPRVHARERVDAPHARARPQDSGEGARRDRRRPPGRHAPHPRRGLGRVARSWDRGDGPTTGLRDDARGAVCAGVQRTATRQAAHVRAGRRPGPGDPALEWDEAMARLATRYFTSHGPAQVRDFAWWSGMTLKDAAVATDLARGQLEERQLGERVFWQAPRSRSAPVRTAGRAPALDLRRAHHRVPRPPRPLGRTRRGTHADHGRRPDLGHRRRRSGRRHVEAGHREAPPTSRPTRSATSPTPRRPRSTRPSIATRSFVSAPTDRD